MKCRIVCNVRSVASGENSCPLHHHHHVHVRSKMLLHAEPCHRTFTCKVRLGMLAEVKTLHALYDSFGRCFPSLFTSVTYSDPTIHVVYPLSAASCCYCIVRQSVDCNSNCRNRYQPLYHIRNFPLLAFSRGMFCSVMFECNIVTCTTVLSVTNFQVEE
jgi:hypothetical protein